MGNTEEHDRMNFFFLSSFGNYKGWEMDPGKTRSEFDPVCYAKLQNNQQNSIG